MTHRQLGCSTQQEQQISTPLTGVCEARPQHRPGEEDPPMHCPFCRNTDTKVLDSRVAEDGALDPPAALLPGLRAAVHHPRADAAHRGEALGRDRGVRPRQGDRRRPQGLQGPAADRGRPGPPRPASSRTPCVAPARRSSPPTRSGWPSSSRCASSTRSPTCASPRSTSSSSPPRTSRSRSPSLRKHRAEQLAAILDSGSEDLHLSPQRLTHRPPGASWGSGVPGDPPPVPLSVPAGVSVPPATLISRDHNECDQGDTG